MPPDTLGILWLFGSAFAAFVLWCNITYQPPTDEEIIQSFKREEH